MNGTESRTGCDRAPPAAPGASFRSGRLRRAGKGRARFGPAPAALLLALLAPTGPGCLAAQEDVQRERRLEMVRTQIEAEGIRDPATLAAMRSVPRHEFVPSHLRDRAYADRPLPIGEGQTISQPYIVAYMTERLEVEPGDTVLEVGTGSGYQSAVLAEVGVRVFTVEIFASLAGSARERLDRLGYESVTVRHGDGFHGWPERAPFDAVVVTAAAGFIPPPLLEQLRPGGRMVIPVGSRFGVQHLVLVRKEEDGSIRTRNLLPVRFVSLLRETP